MEAIWLRLSLALLVLPTIYADVAVAQTAVQRTIEDVGGLLQKGDAEAAIEKLQSLEEAADGADRARVSNALGYALFSTGKENAAIEELQNARAIAEREGDRETLVKATNNLGLVHFTRGDMPAAREAFESAAAMGSDFAKDYLELVERQERAGEAKNLVNEGVKAARYGKDFATAERKYSEALEMDPENARVLNFRGYARFRLGELEMAEADLRRAVSLDPDRPIPRINLLKVRCAMDSDAPLPAELGPRTTEELELYAGDGELRRVCGERLNRLLS